MNIVCTGSCIKCPFSMGGVPSNLNVLPSKMVNTQKKPCATIMDNIPIVNIKPFGMCISPLNPAVQAIIASSLGTVQYAPCIPATVAPWTVGKPTLLTGKLPTLNATSTLMCMWGGVITIMFPGQTGVMHG